MASVQNVKRGLTLASLPDTGKRDCARKAKEWQKFSTQLLMRTLTGGHNQAVYCPSGQVYSQFFRYSGTGFDPFFEKKWLRMAVRANSRAKNPADPLNLFPSCKLVRSGDLPTGADADLACGSWPWHSLPIPDLAAWLESPSTLWGTPPGQGQGKG